MTKEKAEETTKPKMVEKVGEVFDKVNFFWRVVVTELGVSAVFLLVILR